MRATENVIIKKSRISGKGVFAGRDFKKGEVILRWNPVFVKKSEFAKLSKNKKAYIAKIGKRYYFMQSPEKYVNHSCRANTVARNRSDVAIENIKKGEEITSSYSGLGVEPFKCKCGNKKCKGTIL